MPLRSRRDLTCPARAGRPARRLASAVLPLALVAVPVVSASQAVAATAEGPRVSALPDRCAVAVMLPEDPGTRTVHVTMTVLAPSVPAGQRLQLSDEGRWQEAWSQGRVWRLDLSGFRTSDERGHRLRVDVRAEGQPAEAVALWLPRCLPAAAATTSPSPTPSASAAPVPPAAATPSPTPSTDPTPPPTQAGGVTPPAPSGPEPETAPEPGASPTAVPAGAQRPAPAAPARPEPAARTGAPTSSAAPARGGASTPVEEAVPPHLLGTGTDGTPDAAGGVGVATAPALEAGTLPQPAAPADVPPPQIAPAQPDDEQTVVLERAAAETGLAPLASDEQGAVEELLPGTSGLALLTAAVAAALVRRRVAAG